MKRLLFCVFTIVLIALAGCSKQDTRENMEPPEFSDYYLVGFPYGGSGFGEPIAVSSADVIICTDHTVQILLPHVDATTGLGDYELRDTLTLTDEQYANIEELVDRDRMWNLETNEAAPVCR